MENAYFIHMETGFYAKNVSAQNFNTELKNHTSIMILLKTKAGCIPLLLSIAMYKYEHTSY